MNDLLERLKHLVSELQELPGWPGTKLPVGLLVYDVLVALDATGAEVEEVLGKEMLILVGDPALQDAERTPSPQVC